MAGGRHLGRRSRVTDVIAFALGGVILTGAFVVQQRSPTYRIPAAVGEVPLAQSAFSFQQWLGPLRATRPIPPIAIAPGRLHIKRASSPSRPWSLTIPSQSIGGAVVPVGYDRHTGELGVPGDPLTLGWWAGSAWPGERSGTVVIDGHVDTLSKGKGVLFALENVGIGQRIELLTDKGIVAYRAVARRTYAKDQLPPDVFAQSGRARLVLITCGGAFDQKTHHYQYNIVLYALPA